MTAWADVETGFEPVGMWLVAAAAKKKRSKSGSGWNWRLAGIALCTFFALGVITGLSESGRLLARRVEALLHRLPHSNRSDLIPAAFRIFFKEPAQGERGSSSARSPTEAIALAEHPDGFYQLDSKGGLLGPVSPVDAVDLPVLSGSDVEHAPATQLVEYAGDLVRAEAILAATISEMRLTSNGEIHLYLDRPHLVIILTRTELPVQLARAAKVLSVWRGRLQLIEMIDMTVPEEAIVRPKAEDLERSNPVTAD